MNGVGTVGAVGTVGWVGTGDDCGIAGDVDVEIISYGGGAVRFSFSDIFSIFNNKLRKLRNFDFVNNSKWAFNAIHIRKLFQFK